MSLWGTVKIKPEVVGQAIATRGMYQFELAEKAGISAMTLSRAMNGKAVSVGTARDIADALKIPLRSMIAETHSRGADFAVTLANRSEFQIALENVGSKLRGEE